MKKNKTISHTIFRPDDEWFDVTLPEDWNDTPATAQDAVDTVLDEFDKLTALEEADRKERLMDRTCAIIDKHGVIYLKNAGGWYLSAHTSISAGYEEASWMSRSYAMPIDNLEWAFALAKLYKCRVVSYYPERRR